jgi:predicted transposase/invertase (TIGR01784 family)
MARYLDPKADVVFKKIFGQHPHLLKSFLNAILPLPSGTWIESLEYLSSEQAPEIPAFKTTVVDVKCKDQTGRIFIVEMQVQWTDSFKQRLLFGASTAYVRQLKPGENYNLLKPVYGLGLLASIFDKDNERWYHHYKLVNIGHPEQEIKHLQLVFIELPKFKPSSFKEKKLQVLWLRFMSELDEETQTIPEEWLSEPDIAEAVQLSQQSAFTPSELLAYDKYWDAVSTEKTLLSGAYDDGVQAGHEQGVRQGLQDGLYQGIQQGIKQGIQQGIEQGSHEAKICIALKLIQSGMDKTEVMSITGLSLRDLEKFSLALTEGELAL